MDLVVCLPFSIFLVSEISIKQIKGNEIKGFFTCLQMLLSIRPDLGGDTPIGKGHLAVVRGCPRPPSGLLPRDVRWRTRRGKGLHGGLLVRAR